MRNGKFVLVFVCIILCLSYSESVKCQNNNGRSNVQYVRPLEIGDEVPDILIENMANFKNGKARISDFKNKLLIIDLMATSCKSCIRALPAFDSLQQRFGSEIQILLVSFEDSKRIDNFFAKTKIGQQINLPFAAKNTLLKEYFPYEYISHVVWINKGRVKAITNTQYVKERNIRQVLDGESINWPVKRDVGEYEFGQPLLVLNNQNVPEISLPEKSYYSTFAKYLNGIQSRQILKYDSVENTSFIEMINFPITKLYLTALNQSIAFPTSRMKLEVSDKDKYIFDSKIHYKDVWNKENTYSYQAILPGKISDEKKLEKMKQDLDFYTGLNVRMEKRNVECLVLKNTPKSDLIWHDTNFQSEKVFRSYTDPGNGFICETISGLLFNANRKVLACPLINETGYNEIPKLFLKIRDEVFDDLELLKMELKQFGIDVKTEYREVEMFVLTESRYSWENK